MLRNLTLAALPLFALSFTACADSTSDDELAGEADAEDSLDGKSDTPNGASTYFEIRTDMRRCASPMCGGFFIERLNASKTTCHDGVKREICYTPELDWSQSGLSEAKVQMALGKASSAFVSGDVKAVVRGRFAPKNLTTTSPAMGRFIVTEAWVAQGEGVSDGVFAKVYQNGIRCIAAPCPSLTEKALNASRTANISNVDFTAGTYDDAALSGLFSDYTAPSGVIVAGDRYSFTESGRPGKGRTATQAYRNVANIGPTVNDGCFVGGCSSQLCSDTEGLVSTCEFREEYACYRESFATCEKQSNGHCGWTQSGELQACVGTPAN
jgi:hypothetical protein